MVFQAPFLLATMLLAVMALNSCGKTTWKDACRTCGTEMQLLAGALYTTVAAMAGYVINAKILAKSYSFKSFGGVTWSRPRMAYLNCSGSLWIISMNLGIQTEWAFSTSAALRLAWDF